MQSQDAAARGNRRLRVQMITIFELGPLFFVSSPELDLHLVECLLAEELHQLWVKQVLLWEFEVLLEVALDLDVAPPGIMILVGPLFAGDDTLGLSAVPLHLSLVLLEQGGVVLHLVDPRGMLQLDLLHVQRLVFLRSV